MFDARYDGNAILGYRLYKEISKMNSLRKMRGKACSNLPVIYSHWETVATNLEEFQKVSVRSQLLFVTVIFNFLFLFLVLAD